LRTEKLIKFQLLQA